MRKPSEDAINQGLIPSSSLSDVLTRYIAAFRGSPSVSVIPQVFLKSSFGICEANPTLELR